MLYDYWKVGGISDCQRNLVQDIINFVASTVPACCWPSAFGLYDIGKAIQYSIVMNESIMNHDSVIW